jgi:hypothetical protein
MVGNFRGRIQARQQDKKWTLKMERALRRFQPACVICGVTDHLQTHHVKPRCLGNALEPGNAVRLCKACNSSIGMKEPGELSPDMARKLVTAAAQFKEHWESGCTTPAAPTPAPVEESPQVADPALVTLLRAVECGDDNDVLALANWLEDHGDPRASAIREVASLEAVVRETQTGAKEELYWIEYRLNGKRYGPSSPVTRSSMDTEDWLAQRVREVQSRQQSDEVWRRLGLTWDEIDRLKMYLGINPLGHVTAIEEIAQLRRKQVQTIRISIDLALHHLTSRVRRVPVGWGFAWRAVVGDASPVCSDRRSGRPRSTKPQLE